MAAAAIITLAAVILVAMGRSFWCRCGTVRVWYGNAWGPESSQQFTDPYSFTHVTHGVLFYFLLRVLAPNLSLGIRSVLAMALESGWEVLENTDVVIDRYRATTMALGYYGDSVFNSIGDVLSCVVGFLLAARLPTRVTVSMVVLLELALTLWIRDSLLLNIIMLVYSIDAVKTWQLGG